jgi:hypothetical protein
VNSLGGEASGRKPVYHDAYHIIKRQTMKDSRARNRTTYNETAKKYYHLHKNEINEKRRLYRRVHREETRSKQREYKKTHRDSVNKWNRGYVSRLRQKIFSLLGNKCSNPGCLVPGGCEDSDCLQIDHVNGNGTKEIRKFRHADKYYRHILQKIEAGSKDYQLLCVNCNWKKEAKRKEVKLAGII